MRMMRTPLDAWVDHKIGAGGAGLSRELLGRYQLAQLQTTISWAHRQSPFYRNRLQGVAGTDIAALADLSRFPFTTADDLRQYGHHFLCLSQSEVSRVVTLDSSGTTGAAKRLYFTPADQAATIDFFRYGMANLTAAGDRVLILLPGERPGGVGDLLRIALIRMGVHPIPHGVVRDIPATLAVMAREEVDCLVGTPSQVFALARWADSLGNIRSLKSVLLSTDHVPRAVVRELKRVWGCDVFEHYGMTEMGLGGGTDCAAHAGYHLHEADFYFEVVDPVSGEAVPEGGEGEVVVTTLTRRGMPLIRYRTDDISRLIPGPCPCRSVLRRLERITARKDGRITVNGYGHFTLADLDERVLAVAGVTGFTAAVDRAAQATNLTIAAQTVGQTGCSAEREIFRALDAVPAIGPARQAGKLTVTVRLDRCQGSLTPGTAKRAIAELKDTDGNQDGLSGQARQNPPGR